MCFPKRKLKKVSKKIKHSLPQNTLTGCRMIILIDDNPKSKFYRPEYCNCKILEDGLCAVHKELSFIKK